jgi:hypothetical protein
MWFTAAFGFIFQMPMWKHHNNHNNIAIDDDITVFLSASLTLCLSLSGGRKRKASYFHFHACYYRLCLLFTRPNGALSRIKKERERERSENFFCWSLSFWASHSSRAHDDGGGKCTHRMMIIRMKMKARRGVICVFRDLLSVSLNESVSWHSPNLPTSPRRKVNNKKEAGKSSF